MGIDAGQDVHLVSVGDRHEQVGFFNLGLLQDPRAGPLPLDRHDVQFVLNFLQSLRIAVDNHDIVLQLAEFGCKMTARFARAYDYDSHAFLHSKQGIP